MCTCKKCNGEMVYEHKTVGLIHERKNGIHYCTFHSLKCSKCDIEVICHTGTKANFEKRYSGGKLMWWQGEPPKNEGDSK